MKPWHFVVLAVVIVLLFGAQRLPELAKSVGQSLKIFKNEVAELRDETPETQGGTSSPTSDDSPKA